MVRISANKFFFWQNVKERVYFLEKNARERLFMCFLITIFGNVLYNTPLIFITVFKKTGHGFVKFCPYFCQI